MDELFDLTTYDGTKVRVSLSTIMAAFAAEVGPGQRSDLLNDGDPVEIRSRTIGDFRIVVEMRQRQ